MSIPTRLEIQEAIAAADHNLSLTASRFGVSRVTLYRWMRVHDIQMVRLVTTDPEPAPDYSIETLKGQARQAVTVAIAKGELTRQPCVVCGAVHTQAHHYKGYDREHRLDVQWLCFTHHRAIHRKHDPLVVA